MAASAAAEWAYRCADQSRRTSSSAAAGRSKFQLMIGPAETSSFETATPKAHERRTELSSAPFGMIALGSESDQTVAIVEIVKAQVDNIGREPFGD